MTHPSFSPAFKAACDIHCELPCNRVFPCVLSGAPGPLELTQAMVGLEVMKLDVGVKVRKGLCWLRLAKEVQQDSASLVAGFSSLVSVPGSMVPGPAVGAPSSTESTKEVAHRAVGRITKPGLPLCPSHPSCCFVPLPYLGLFPPGITSLEILNVTFIFK